MVAALALVQPWVIAAWQEFVTTGRLDTFTSANIEVGYRHDGATIGLIGLLRARNRDLFVRSVSLHVRRELDQAQHRFHWNLFRATEVNPARPFDSPLMFPMGFMVEVTKPRQFSIVFNDIDHEAQLRPVAEALRPACPPARSAGGERKLEALRRDRRYLQAIAELERLAYWKAGEYRLTLNIETEPGRKVFEQRWPFALSAKDESDLRRNARWIAARMCDVDDPGTSLATAYVPYGTGR